MLNKEQLMSTGISSEDADKILAQYYADSEKAEVIEKEKKVELPPPTPNDITSIAQLSEFAKGQVVRLPAFAPDQPFVARLKRPSMLVLAKSGKIPNSLLETASSLFDGKSKVATNSDNTMGDMYRVLEIIAEASLVSPTMAEIKSAGIELTDEQLIAIFNYSQQGVEGLKSFR
jgi:hypothetical protein